jgi:hypothetical protein
MSSTLYTDYGRVSRFAFTPALSDPFTTSGGNTFSLPPLQDVNQATDIVRIGDTFRFIVPQGHYPQGTFSPAGRDAYFFRAAPAINVLMKAKISDGFIVAISYPHGIPAFAGDLEYTTWRLSDFGSAPPVVAPRAG